MITTRFRSLFLTLCVAVMTPPALAQFDTAEVLGTIRDASGSVVSKATVTLLNQETGIQAKSLLECETIRLIHFKSDVGLADPSAIGNYQGGVFGRHLLYANDNFHPYLMMTEREL